MESISEKPEKSVKKEKTPEKKKTSTAKTNKAAEDFKRKYFEYYDDIKISDRQDW